MNFETSKQQIKTMWKESSKKRMKALGYDRTTRILENQFIPFQEENQDLKTQTKLEEMKENMDWKKAINQLVFMELLHDCVLEYMETQDYEVLMFKNGWDDIF